MQEQKNRVMIIASFLIIVSSIIICGAVFIIDDKERMNREQIELMSGIDKLNFYNENVENDIEDDNTINNLRITLPQDNDEKNVIFDNKYFEKKLIITIPDVDEDFVYNNPIVGNSSDIKDILYEYTSKALKITLELDGIYEYTSFFKGKNCYINFQNPKDMYKKIVVIDAGHGGNSKGIVENGAVESKIDLAVSLKLKKLLKTEGIGVYLTREDDSNPDYESRISIANDLNADMFISIHNNASPQGYEEYSGTQVLYNEKDDTMMSMKLGKLCLKEVVDTLGSKSRQCIEGSSIYIIKESKVPAVLIELGFITNEEEAAKLADDKYQDKAALGIYNAIIKAYEEGF